MRPWSERSPEEAHLLNPAFCCINLISACAGYSGSADRPLPFALCFVVLPITLHRRTRESLPKSIRTSIPAWLQRNTDARIGFYGRVMALRPHTREALHYGLGLGLIRVGQSGGLNAAPESLVRTSIRSLDGEARECVTSAGFLGRWLRRSASTETTMALWGIRP